ncbi:right-handed parallel beta-helix repeat-containing protein [Serratia liquefaciens]|uniref:right-handed parallel beta-helix repeat-containing protein n=1 Tax=Serratia liquefaciens TaxID=614 RepID=UPI0021CA7B69|nr:hypothetical protein [Serratia liquefaciens]
MFHLDNTSAVPEMPEPKEPQSNTPRWFGESQQQGGISWPGADWFNIVQAELINTVQKSGIDLDKHDFYQLSEAIKVLGIQKLSDPYGGENVTSVVHYYEHSSDIKVRAIPNTVRFVYTRKYSTTSFATNETQLKRDEGEDNIFLSSTDWVANGVIRGKALIYDTNGRAFQLMPINGNVSLESLGGGVGGDDSNLMEISQAVSTKPVNLFENKVYSFSRPINHSLGRGWSGKNTTFKCISGMRCPFISSVKTAQGTPNDTQNGTSGVSNLVFENIIIDTNYTDATGSSGFAFAENTLDNWTDCKFVNVTFKNAKFKNISLQNNCKRLIFDGCRFEHSGQDGVIIRKSCEQITFNNCEVVDTAMITSLGGGDGIVVKGKFVLIDGCHFRNVGNGLKGAGIANNAEDVDSVFQASYNTYVNNVFVRCYGGVGIGTVNADFISAGLLIEGITLDNNTFIDTLVTAVGIRYVRDVNHGSCKAIGQHKSGSFAIELINVININGRFDVRTAQGGALTANNCTGRVEVTGYDVSKAAEVNSVVVNSCDGLNLATKITKSARNGLIINAFYNGILTVQLSDILKAGGSFTDIKRTKIDYTVNYCGNNGITMSQIYNCNSNLKIYDAGYEQNAIFSSVRYISGNRNRFNVLSDSGQPNRPSYDLTVESGTSGSVIYHISSAGALGNVNKTPGSTAKIVDELAP